MARREASGRQADPARDRESRDQRGRASRARGRAHHEIRERRRQGARDRLHRLRSRRPRPSTDRLGEAGGARAGSRAGNTTTLALAARGESGRKIIATGERERTLRPMAMGKRKSEQAPLWIPTTELPVSPGHPFYVRLNTILDAAGFDRFVEEQCRAFYAPVMGRPSLAPGRYFRLLLS